jgi:hypothetical protein
MSTYESSQRHQKAVFGAIAVVATVATFGLTVIAPVALSPAPATDAQIAARANARPTEVAILPGTIEVVAKRTKVASTDSSYLPASYNVR